MTTILIAVFATLPFAATGWLAAIATDSLSASPRVRERLWSIAFWGPVIAAAAIPLLAPLFPSVLVVSHSGGGQGPDAGSALATTATTALLAAITLGAVAKLVGVAVRFRKLARIAAAAAPLSNPALVSILDRHATRLGTRRPTLLTTDAVTTPVLVGLRRPVILFPGQMSGVSTDRLALVGAHELAHLKRGDNPWVLAEGMALAMLWFNPVLPLIARRLTAAREEARDALALAGASLEARHDYAQIFLDTLRLGAGPKQHSAFIGAGRKHTAMRLRNILQPVPPSSSRALIGGASALTMIAGLSLGSVAIAAQIGPVRVQAETITYSDVRISQGSAEMPAQMTSGKMKVAKVRYSVDGKLMPQDFNPEPWIAAAGTTAALKGVSVETPEGAVITFDLKTP